MRIHFAVAWLGCWLGLMSAAWADAPKQLPPPDYDAIEAAAQRVEPGHEYVAVLADRLRECTATATPYASSPITADMVESKVIRMTCLRAMMRRMAELYFEPGAFGLGGIEARIDELSKPLYTIYYNVLNKGMHCEGRPCGSIFEQLAPRDEYVDFLLDLTRFMASFAPEGSVPGDWRNWQCAWAKAARFEQYIVVEPEPEVCR